MPDSPLDSLQESAEAPDIDQPRRRIGKRGLEQNMVRLMLAEHVIDEIGRNGHLPACLLLTRMASLDQSGDDGANPEGALHQTRFGKPGVEIVSEHVLIEEL